MLFADTKEKISRSNILRDVDLLGSFDFYTAIISLESLVAKDLEDFKGRLGEIWMPGAPGEAELSAEQYAIASKVLPLLVHECTHFVDSTSTLWGLRHLQLMNSAYIADDRRGGIEQHFVSAKAFFDHARRIRLPEYYTTVSKGTPNVRPWKSKVTLGKLFGGDGTLSDRGVLFSRFSNKDGNELVRSPVSTVSLLEASAMAQELDMETGLLQCTEPNFRIVERKLLVQRTVDYIYNEKITEYSVCAHLVANSQNCSDAFLAFRACAVLTRLVLNFSEEVFQKITESCPVSELLNVEVNHPYADAYRNSLRHCDLGAAFYLLCLALPKDTYLNDANLDSGIREALAKIGVSFDFVIESATAVAEALAAELAASEIVSIAILAKAGISNFKKINVLQPEIKFFELNLPPVFLADSNCVQFFNVESNSLRVFELEKSFEELYFGQSWVERFSEGCI